FFFQAEDGIRDFHVTGVQTCALPIFFGNGTQRWWGDLFEDPGFWQLYVDRWQMWRDTVLSDESVGALVDAFAAELNESQARNSRSEERRAGKECRARTQCAAAEHHWR